MTSNQQNTAARKFGLPHIILILGLGILLCGEAYFGYRLQALSSEQEQIKEDYSTVNNITFGIFSVDKWRERIAEVINRQVSDFHMTRAQKKALQAQVEHELHSLVNKTVAEINKPQKSLGGKLKKLAFNAMVNADDIQAQVPAFSKTIIDKVSSPASTKRLKNIATSKLTQLENQTYDSTYEADSAVTKSLFSKYHVAGADEFNKNLDTRLAAIRTVTYNYAYAMLGCVVFALALWLLMRNQVHLHTPLFVMSLLFALILLVVGITATIIQVDARIQTFNFTLMGEKVAFDNQVLFFQSKSIFGIVKALISQTKPDAVLVGILILLFIIVLPMLRMIAKGIHIVSPKKIAENRVVRYLAFESGKWDMADVMVVGILMTYIGLNGIIKSQLSNLNIHSGSLNAITENNTSLQPGYIIFAGYVIFALILSRILKRITAHGEV
ncbi:paraquat-inducible protein A [Mucilaginibacter flavidus]|uniref:paraquat-inducible protein A n=1 Tax=Mucilaginibacter flavidus TaxID=2949309 RepID=UPI002093017D|nr:paraquat-inducible protein A [Mucilaginibacter flavidus]MCO5949803.1 paraquat-inducible protein A [Mucilaginibacter flavidus]